MHSALCERAARAQADVMHAHRARVAITRLVILNSGLMLMGLGTALMLEARLGVAPWAVLHEGVALNTPLSHGVVSQLVGLVILLLAWLWLRQPAGIGTVFNIVMLGLWIDLFRAQAWLPAPEAFALRALQLLAATALYAFANALYLAADLGAGPRDGLMLGAARRFRLPVRAVRSAIELSALAGGWVLGGPVGLGTVIYALAVGPLIQRFMRMLRGGAYSARLRSTSHS